MPSPRSSTRCNRRGTGASSLRRISARLLAFAFAAALLPLPAAAQESPRNVIRWRNDRGDVQQLDVGPSIPRSSAEPDEEDEAEQSPEEKLRDEERRRLEAERDKLELQKEIAELEREIEAIDRQVKDIRSRQEDEYDERYESDLEYYLGLQIRRRADKRRLWRRYHDRYPAYRFRDRQPKQEPSHRIRKKMQ